MRINKDGTVNWSLGSIVEVTTYTGNYDPNRYFARCLTGGTWPKVQVLHEKYPEPLQAAFYNTPVAIWRELPEEEAQKILGDEEYVVNKVREEAVERLCPECGYSLLEPSPGCSRLHFGEDKPFTAF